MIRRSFLALGASALAGAAARVIAVQERFSGRRAGDERELMGIRFCWCPPGRFVMGSPPREPERRPGEDQVAVNLTRGFWMAKYESTQGQWLRVLASLPGQLTAELPAGADYPVGNVNFGEAEAYCAALTGRALQAGVMPGGWEFRLPTEAQWEYACRAGTTTATAFGDSLGSSQANFRGRPYNGAEAGPSLNRAARVGSYRANAWGLHDMHGNTFEWCRDWYHARLPGGTDPDLHTTRAAATANRDGSVSRVRRGGCWADDGWACRSAFRTRFEPERRYDHIGFRIVTVHVT
jgi:formylglycine-generating enzyme required for sulfatase activity